MTYRRATLDDLEPIVQLIARADAQSGEWVPGGMPHPLTVDYDRDRLLRHIPDEEGFSEVAEVAGSLTGFVNFEPREGVAHVSYVFVDPGFQRRGIGRELLTHAVEVARGRGFPSATLVTAEPNRHARRFYEREGWALTGRVTFNDEIELEMVEYGLDL